MRKIKISWIVLANIILTFSLLMLGALVHNTQSSLACPDWPLCYGQVFPKMEGAILVEHSHRLLATTVGLLTILILILNIKFKSSKKIILFSAISLSLVIMQGVLGGITVIYKLPTIVSTFHLGLSLLYFSTLIYLHHLVRQFETPKVLEKFNFPLLTLKQLLFFSTLLLYLQILLGAFMRHSGAGVACGLNLDHSVMCFDTVTWKNSWWPENIPAQMHIVHRYFAFLVFLFNLFTTIILAKKIKPLRKYMFSSTLFLMTQIALGVWTVASGISVIPTTLHLAGAALSLAMLVKSNIILNELSVLNKEEHNMLSDIFNLTKPKLTSLVMATVFVGMVLAPGESSFFKSTWAFILILMVVMGAGALNCYIERDIDSKMDRTKNRSLPAGRLSPDAALVFGTLFTVMPIVLIYFQVNPTTAILALAASVLYLFAYTPMKQRSENAVFVGALPGALPPILGFTAITGKVDLLSGAIYLIMLIWQIPHFFAISLFHSEDYGRAKILTFPNVKGSKITDYNILIFTIILMISTFLPYYFGEASKNFYYAALVLGFLFAILALRGVFSFNSDKDHKTWAHQYFYASIIYLPLLLLALIFFK